MRPFVTTSKFFFEVFQELPVAITVARRTVIQIRIIYQIFRAMSVIRIVLMRHPVRMRFRHPTRMTVVAKPARHALQTMRELVRSPPIILERTDSNPHARPILAIQSLHIILATVQGRQCFKHINIAFEFSVRAFRERKHPPERINVKRIHLFKRLEYTLGIRCRNGNIIRRTIVGLWLFANLEMFRRTNQRKAIAFTLRNPVYVCECDNGGNAYNLRK